MCAVPLALPSSAHLAQLLGVEGDDSHGVATAGGTNHELSPVSTLMEEDAGVQGGVTDELLIALRAGEMSPLVHEDNCPALSSLRHTALPPLLFLFHFNTVHESSLQVLERQHVLIISICNSYVF